MLVKDIEQAMYLTEQQGKGFGESELSKGALVHLCRRIEGVNQTCRLIELGGGTVTSFWGKLRSLELIELEVVTLEHDPDVLNKLEEDLRGQSHIHISPQALKQITDEEWASLFDCPLLASAMWDSCGKTIPEDKYRHYTIRNAFYSQPDRLPFEKNTVDVLVVDGPHGNGRSLAFPLFAPLLRPDALVLIDDYDHYPFLDDLGKVFRYDELHLEPAGSKRWSLVRLDGLRA